LTAANLLVIASNDGFIPISPETSSRLVSAEMLQRIEVGRNFDWEKFCSFLGMFRLPRALSG
jgi:hypothetical protein